MRRFLPLVLLLVVVSTATARTWTSRSGGFSMEADLVDVRDGNAVLKKADGTEISVPLGKLSLGDIRFIESVFKSAEAGVGMKPEGAAATPATGPAAPTAPATPAPPAAAAGAKPGAAGSRPLGYDWQAGQTFSYHVRTEVQLGSGSDEIQANVHYTVKAVSPDGVAEIRFVETITHSRKGDVAVSTTHYYPTPRAFYPRVSHAPHYYHGRYPLATTGSDPETVKVDRLGRIVSSEGGSHLPYFLGRAAHMPFETLATDGENPWAVATDVAFRLSRVDWFPTASLGSLRNEELPGREKSTYQLENAGGERVTLGKTYEAASAAKVEGKPQVALNGDGSLSFDAGRRLFASSKMKIRVSVHDGPVLLEVPVAVSYDLVSEAEEAKLKADLEKSRQDREKFSQDLKRPVTAANLDEVVTDLQSPDHMKVAAARTRLTSRSHDAPDRKLLAALEGLVDHENATVREAAATALAQWATKDDVPALVKMLDNNSAMVRGDALRALGRLKATSAIERIVRQLPQDEFTASQALREMGPAAEPAMLKLLAQGDRKSRGTACQVLGAVGTKKSLPALEKLRDDGDQLTEMYAQQAIRSIKHRQ